MPETREELLEKLMRAQQIAHQHDAIQDEIAANRARLDNRQAALVSPRPTWMYAAAGVAITFTLVTSTPLRLITGIPSIPFSLIGGPDVGLAAINAINLAITFLVGIPLGTKVFRNMGAKRREKKNLEIEAQNNLIAASNEEIEGTIAELQNTLEAVRRQWIDEVLPWYPADYNTSYAVDCFCRYVKTQRASTIQEMVNIYETEMHQKRMENSQKKILSKQQEMVNQQRLGNVLQVGNLVMQGQQLSQMRQTAASAASAATSASKTADVANRMARKWNL